jgi:small-conductance mechanosensitive channel
MLDLLTAFSSEFSWLEYLLQIGLLTAAAWFLRRMGMKLLRERARQRPSPLSELLLVLLNKALVPILLLAVLAASLNLFPLPEKVLTVLNRGVYAAFLIVVLYYGFQATQILLNHWLSRSAADEAMREPSRFFIRIVFLVVGVMLLLENLGISLTALWTTLGVGSVAVALALQDTLSNFFGGIYLHLDQPVRIGDYVKLGTDEEGYVVQVGWRSTRIRTLPGNVVVIPNSKLATQVITNYSMPSEEMSLLIPVNVGYDSDPELIERVLVEEATREAEKIAGLRQDPPPFVRFIPGFGDSALNFTLICRVNSYADQYLVQHELRKRILARFRREGIQIPFPQRDVHLHTSVPAATGTPHSPRADTSA